MALIIAGERSGVGKTTVTLTLLAALHQRALKVQSFKVGPDYIDSMFHEYVTGQACRNLDPILTSEAYIQKCFARHTQSVDYALVEGVMGLFDGLDIRENMKLNSLFPIPHSPFPINFASTSHIAYLLNLPVLLVIDCSRLSGSVAAIAHGYRSFDNRIKLAGIVLNRVGSDRHLELLKEAIQPLEIPILGILRRHDNITIPDRHLGLVPIGEIPQLDTLIKQWAHLGETCFDWTQLLPLLKCPKAEIKPQKQVFTELQTPNSKLRIPIAIAKDKAFNFYYQDNLDLLVELGAELIFWSPLKDACLPEGVQALYFGGGFPEVFAAELSNNILALESVKKAIIAGIPTYAECGGLMYLCNQIIDFQKRSHSLVGVLPTSAVMGDRLILGYRQAVALQTSPMLEVNSHVRGHEFHRSHLTTMPTKALFKMRGYSQQSEFIEEGWQIYKIHASYLHLHWGVNSHLAKKLIANAKLFWEWGIGNRE